MPRIKRSRESRIGGGARWSRRHSPRNSKIVAAESRASSSARSIDVFSMSAAAPRLDVVAADPRIRLGRRKRGNELPFFPARPEPPPAVLLPVCCLHHLLEARPRGLAQQCEHALLLGDPLAPRVKPIRQGRLRDMRKVDYANASACRGCPLRPRCTNNYRAVSRLENED